MRAQCIRVEVSASRHCCWQVRVCSCDCAFVCERTRAGSVLFALRDAITAAREEMPADVRERALLSMPQPPVKATKSVPSRPVAVNNNAQHQQQQQQSRNDDKHAVRASANTTTTAEPQVVELGVTSDGDIDVVVVPVCGVCAFCVLTVRVPGIAAQSAATAAWRCTNGA
jgi:hypothetical protein